MIKRYFNYSIGTVFGFGYFPKAPGTAGSLAGLLAFWFLPISFGWVIFLLTALFFLGVWTSAQIETLEGTDPGLVVIDEFVGQGIACLLLPKSLLFYALAFILFRFFDILKPLGIDRLQDLPGGWGIMTDDLLAGLYANILLQFVYLTGLI